MSDTNAELVAIPNPLEVYRKHHGHLMHAQVIAAIERSMTMIDALLNHCDKESGECSVCSVIVCPHKDSFHFHHDGCPSCSTLQMVKRYSHWKLKNDLGDDPAKEYVLASDHDSALQRIAELEALLRKQDDVLRGILHLAQTVMPLAT